MLEMERLRRVNDLEDWCDLRLDIACVCIWRDFRNKQS